MDQNDIKTTSKRQIDKYFDNKGFFTNPADSSLFACSQKISKIVSALHLIAGVMKPDLALGQAIREQSLGLLNACYETLAQGSATADTIARIVARIEQVISLVEIGSVTQEISSMNSGIISGELVKTRGLLIDDIGELRIAERAYSVSKSSLIQPPISEKMLADDAFDAVVFQNDTKRHQNDIKTTLTTQNDKVEIQNDIKTTLVKNPLEITHVDRQKDILNLIKSRRFSTIHNIKQMAKHYSDKTIQREIASLIELGLVKREGNKRWAVYIAN